MGAGPTDLKRAEGSKGVYAFHSVLSFMAYPKQKGPVGLKSLTGREDHRRLCASCLNGGLGEERLTHGSLGHFAFDLVPDKGEVCL